MNRKDVLLRAACDLLATSDRSHYVPKANSIVVRYDDADCDGDCLREDIAMGIGINLDMDPIPLAKEEV